MLTVNNIKHGPWLYLAVCKFTVKICVLKYEPKFIRRLQHYVIFRSIKTQLSVREKGKMKEILQH